MERLRAQRRKRLRTGPFQGDLLRLRQRGDRRQKRAKKPAATGGEG